MTDLEALRRAALVGVALAVVIGLVATPAYLAAFGWDVEAATFVHPEAALDQGPGTSALWHWGFAGDMLFSYLLLMPLALFLHRRLRERRPWLADVGLIGALSYILIGSASAAILTHAGGHEEPTRTALRPPRGSSRKPVEDRRRLAGETHGPLSGPLRVLSHASHTSLGCTG
jgi:hypothetical protein